MNIDNTIDKYITEAIDYTKDDKVWQMSAELVKLGYEIGDLQRRLKIAPNNKSRSKLKHELGAKHKIRNQTHREFDEYCESLGEKE